MFPVQVPLLRRTLHGQGDVGGRVDGEPLICDGRIQHAPQREHALADRHRGHAIGGHPPGPLPDLTVADCGQWPLPELRHHMHADDRLQPRVGGCPQVGAGRQPLRSPGLQPHGRPGRVHPAALAD